jgi:hypothetical protein
MADTETADNIANAPAPSWDEGSMSGDELIVEQPEGDAAAPRGFELRWQGCNTGC